MAAKGENNAIVVSRAIRFLFCQEESAQHRRSAAKGRIRGIRPFVGCIDGMDSSCNLVGIRVPKLLCGNT